MNINKKFEIVGVGNLRKIKLQIFENYNIALEKALHIWKHCSEEEKKNGDIIINKLFISEEIVLKKEQCTSVKKIQNSFKQLVNLESGTYKNELEELTIKNLEYVFNQAIIRNLGIMVEVTIPRQEDTEFIINRNKSLKNKLEYYKKTYNEVLVHKKCPDIRIIAIYMIVEDWLKDVLY